jgi:carbonic anhydrase
MSATAPTATDTLLERNAELSSDLSAKAFTLTPDLHALILTCADHRVDPAQVLGLELGEAVVLRNPGGRVTPAFISELAVLATVAQIEGLETGFELILMHHTDCGMARLDGPEQRGLMAYFFGVGEDEVAARHLTDPRRVSADRLGDPAREPTDPAHADRLSRHLRHCLRTSSDHLPARPARRDLLETRNAP